MIKNKNFEQNRNYKYRLFASILISLSFVCLIASSCTLFINHNYQIIHNSNDDKTTKISAPIVGWINLTNNQINKTYYFPNEILIIKGRYYFAPTNTSISGANISLIVDKISYKEISNLTDVNGLFELYYIIPGSNNIYDPYPFEVEVNNPNGTVKYLNYFNIYYGSFSYFDINEPSEAKLTGEIFSFDSYLRYDNGTGIPFASINYSWYNGPTPMDSNFVLTDGLGLIQSFSIPDVGTDDLDLKLTFQSLPEIAYSETIFTNTKVFSNITCIWNLSSTIRALSDLTIAGRVVSKNDPTVVINNRLIDIYYNGTLVSSNIQTGSNGEFSISHSLNNSTGSTFISIRLQNTLAKNLVTRLTVTVQPVSTLPGPGPGPQLPPFLLFFSIFLPILGVVIGGLAFYGYRYYKKQDKLSKVVNLPLENKITNLKILKETGRLEESLSYLFNAIYMDLINAKFGRTRNINETIRDFAIISVKELSLTPARIYPFIQKVEEIIYAKPFQITDKEFYSTIDLFSPIYFELTGYNFVLKF